MAGREGRRAAAARAVHRRRLPARSDAPEANPRGQVVRVRPPPPPPLEISPKCFRRSSCYWFLFELYGVDLLLASGGN